MTFLLKDKFFIGNQAINSTVTQTASVGEKWKTYTNDSLGFSFEVPSKSSVSVDRYGSYFTITVPNVSDQINFQLLLY